MNLIDIPIGQLTEAAWNANRMDEGMACRLKESICRFGLVQNLVARKLPDGRYEVLSGNQRLKLLRESGVTSVPCFVVDLGDGQARLLAQALNHIHGQDDLGVRAELLRDVLKAMPEADALAVLPESAQGLRSLASTGQETMAAYLQNWQQAQAARLKHLQFQLTAAQLEVVEEALTCMLPAVRVDPGDTPNARGAALFRLCQSYLERKGRP